MERSPLLRVTLSNDLLKHLRKTAREIDVPLRWLVAGLVCDTLEAKAAEQVAFGSSNPARSSGPSTPRMLLA